MRNLFLVFVLFLAVGVGTFTSNTAAEELYPVVDEDREIYEVLEDVRVTIGALREKEYPREVIKNDGSVLNSSVLWLGKGSKIIIIKNSDVDIEKWRKYLKKFLPQYREVEK